ncbi:amino acid--tRNA ligase-related protein [Streptomyces sp. NPDC090445]|uniref:amino acid--tRNA ligase-related protein n=1 Tax=Streptomyces sp. NPDC090445 TaxID=3365963 RepID=UPI0037F80E15
MRGRAIFASCWFSLTARTLAAHDHAQSARRGCPGIGSRLDVRFDLLSKRLEITAGAQHEHCSDILLKQAEEKGMETEFMPDYLSIFRRGCPPHCGLSAGLGILMVILGLDFIRQVAFLFRGLNRLTP